MFTEDVNNRVIQESMGSSLRSVSRQKGERSNPSSESAAPGTYPVNHLNLDPENCRACYDISLGSQEVSVRLEMESISIGERAGWRTGLID